jgi:hypothetical protein
MLRWLNLNVSFNRREWGELNGEDARLMGSGHLTDLLPIR